MAVRGFLLSGECFLEVQRKRGDKNFGLGFTLDLSQLLQTLDVGKAEPKRAEGFGRFHWGPPVSVMYLHFQNEGSTESWKLALSCGKSEYYLLNNRYII
jgi:hypothetical protein